MKQAQTQGKETVFLFLAFAFVLAFVLLHEFFSVNILAFALASQVWTWLRDGGEILPSHYTCTELDSRMTSADTDTDHVIGFSDLVDLCVIKIKSLWSFAHVIRRYQVNRARNADHAASTCKRFVYSVVKITRLYGYQTWQIHFFFEKFTRCAKVCGLFSWFYFSGADWLGKQTAVTWDTFARKR